MSIVILSYISWRKGESCLLPCFSEDRRVIVIIQQLVLLFLFVRFQLLPFLCSFVTNRLFGTLIVLRMI